ncbi:hypothetical protein ACQP04_23535 [Pseudonocardia halophobica]|uniref:hypothetical protein n=1 Tax=Pseudonocardia halophobica TaxID=29401 RepID=UPI003D8FB9D2
MLDVTTTRRVRRAVGEVLTAAPRAQTPLLLTPYPFLPAVAVIVVLSLLPLVRELYKERGTTRPLTTITAAGDSFLRWRRSAWSTVRSAGEAGGTR